MRKFVLIPVVKLGRHPEGHFLEMMSEPGCFGGVNFQALKTSGLTTAVVMTERILSGLTYSALAASDLYLCNHFLNLNGLKSITLGLCLAAFMQQKTCPYRKIIAIGEIDADTVRGSVLGSPYFETLLTAVLALGKQPYAVPLYLSATMLDHNASCLADRLAELNIVLKPVATVYEALADFGVSLNREER